MFASWLRALRNDSPKSRRRRGSRRNRQFRPRSEVLEDRTLLAAYFQLSEFPLAVPAGVASAFSVTAMNDDGTKDELYAGSLHFTSSDAQAVLPADSTLTQGAATLGFTLKTPGTQSITATDTVISNITGSLSADVQTVTAQTVFAQPPSAAGGLIASSRGAPVYTGEDEYVYDNFRLSSAQTITEIEWRGGYLDNAPDGGVANFSVTIFDSIQGGSQPRVGNPQLPEIYLAKYVVGGSAGETLAGTFGGTTMYDYKFALPTPFQAAAGTRYWLRIEADQNGTPDWGIAIGTGGNNQHYRFSADPARFSFGTNDAAFALLTSATPTFNISASAAPSSGGTVSGGGAYPVGSTANLAATPNPGFGFVNWTENGTPVSSSASFSFTVGADRTLTANFAPAATIATLAWPSHGGSTSGSGVYSDGASVTVVAAPNPGFGFVNWTENDTPVSASASYRFTVAADRTLTANFATVGTGATFDFDAGTPALVTGQSVPFDQTSGPVTAHFSGVGGSGFSVQTDDSTGYDMSLFSGHYLRPDPLSPGSLDISFNRRLSSIIVTFATADFQPGETPTTVQLTAYQDSTGTAAVGLAAAQGTYSSDTMPMGTLAFDSAVPFNLVRIGIPAQPGRSLNFLVDDITVTTTDAFGITLGLSTLPAALAGSPFSATITASDGTAPYVFALTSGTLPDGLTLASDGTLSGTPTAGDTFTFTVQATDSNAVSGSHEYSLTVDAVADNAWHNGVVPYDVDGLNGVTPLDVLTIINRINSHPDGSLPAPPAAPPPYYDVSNDGICTAIDVLLVINHINGSQAGGSGEGSGSAGDALADPQLLSSSPALRTGDIAPLAAEGEVGLPATTPSGTLTGLDSPWALAFDSSGNLYVANFNVNTVSKFAPGSLTPTATLTGVEQPRTLAFDGSGNLYVANATASGTVSKFAPGSTTPSDILTGLRSPHALAFDADGNLYVANNVENGFVSQFAPGSTTPGDTLTGLDHPLALAFDSSGNLYVASFEANSVSRFAPGSTTPSDSIISVNSPTALAFDAAGNLHVASLFGDTVSRFAPGSTTPSAVLTGLSGPAALAFDTNGKLYVANYQGNTVSRFVPGSTTASATLTGLNSPAALAFDTGGNLYVANFQGNTVSKINPAEPDPVPTATLTGQATDLVHDLVISWPVVAAGTPSLVGIKLAGTDITQYAIPLSATSAVVPALSFPATASLPLTIDLNAAGTIFASTIHLDVVPPDLVAGIGTWATPPFDLLAKAVHNEVLRNNSPFSDAVNFPTLCADMMQAARSGNASTFLQTVLKDGLSLLFAPSRVGLLVGGSSGDFVLADVLSNRLPQAMYAALAQQPDMIRKNEILWESFLISYQDFVARGLDVSGSGLWHPAPDGQIGMAGPDVDAALWDLLTQTSDAINDAGPTIAEWFNSVFSIAVPATVDLTIVDPSGRSLDGNGSAVPYTFVATDSDPTGNPPVRHFYVYWPKPGSYRVVAAPSAAAQPDDVFTLTAFTHGVQTVLADQTPVGFIASEYRVDVPGHSPNPWRNYPIVLDTNGDENLTPLDVLVVVNYLNAHGPGTVPATPLSPPLYLDTDGNGTVTPLDALVLINHFNRQSPGTGEGEAMSIASPLGGPSGPEIPAAGDRGLTPRDVDLAAGGLELSGGDVDGILPDIAQDVWQGWKRDPIWR